MIPVTLIDYGIGNLHSVIKGLAHTGAAVKVTSDLSEVTAASRLVLPGVGAFGDGMAQLRARNLVEPILEYARLGRPFLGICVGMQVLFSESDEFGLHSGLDLIPGRVERVQTLPGDKVPHVGWNRLVPPQPGRWAQTALRDLKPGAQMYFVHSFAPVPRDPAHVLAVTHYSEHSFAAAVARDNIVGCQFHPEKSGEEGLSILRNFLRL